MTSNKLTVEAKSNGAKASWTFDGAPEGAEYQVTWRSANGVDNALQFRTCNATEDESPELLPGKYYTVTVGMMNPYNKEFTSCKSKTFKTIFSIQELDKLYLLALKGAMPFPTSNGLLATDVFTVRLNYIHRCKSPDYFANQALCGKTSMKKKLRSATGHRANALISESKLKGVYFSTKVWNGGRPDRSPFGTEQFYIEPSKIIDSLDNFSLYFADFYCITGFVHYVTLVLCRRGTKEEKFCCKHLKFIDLSDNIFFKVTNTENGYVYSTANYVYVELCVTQEIPYCNGDTENVKLMYEAPLRVEGCGHNSRCSACNIDSSNENRPVSNSSEIQLNGNSEFPNRTI